MSIPTFHFMAELHFFIILPKAKVFKTLLDHFALVVVRLQEEDQKLLPESRSHCMGVLVLTQFAYNLFQKVPERSLKQPDKIFYKIVS